MTELNQVYKCNVCGNLVEVMHTGAGQLVCCGQPMQLMKENAVDASKEKHVPVAERASPTLKVKVGSIPHPMEEKHYIEWIEVIAGEKVYRRQLRPGDRPEAEFEVPEGNAQVRAYCNLHGLWKA
ncbi:desulfoferrodoxin [Methanocella sp. CWC-04]|uniref:Desulfoferrodoxin n=1 Tax=Methanooceanicella nereidis TaxID=2052831 RepID=A0AAP2RC15_9EURY|nr:desulfoferrodoxin [Methanocella sp. CWC-04]